MNQNMAKEYLALERLGIDDSFDFKCHVCGKCCRERDDILLTPFEMFNISRHLNMTPRLLFGNFCDTFIGAKTGISVVKVRPNQYRRTCPFCYGGKCAVYPVRPGRCNLYPLGRMDNVETGESAYIMQPVKCGERTKKQTVREWLTDYTLESLDKFGKLWMDAVARISALTKPMLGKLNEDQDEVYDIVYIMFEMLYMNYDHEKDFYEQFEENVEKAVKELEALSVRVEQLKETKE